MLPEWTYYFYETGASKEILEYLEKLEEEGTYLGFTYPEASTHSCFTETQCEQLENVIKEKWQNSLYQKLGYFRGDLFDADVGIKTFKQPFVQWCPSPIYSSKAKELISSQDPWGLSFEKHVILKRSLREIISAQVTGLKIREKSIGAIYDSYQIENANLPLSLVNYAKKKPLGLDCSKIEKWDIFSFENNTIICSSRFASLLKSDWDGMVHNKFQPVRCENIPETTMKRNLKKIPIVKIPDISKDIVTIEKQHNIKFPSEYRNWVLSLAGKLPEGWLSPIGGKKSELAKYIHQEHESAEPRLSAGFIPVFAYGDGDSICVERGTGKFVEWNHEDGETVEIDMPDGFAHWLELQED